jgi:hypothetical protein
MNGDLAIEHRRKIAYRHRRSAIEDHRTIGRSMVAVPMLCDDRFIDIDGSMVFDCRITDHRSAMLV